MVYDSFDSFVSTPSEQHDGDKRSLESRSLSYQKMQEVVGDSRKRARECSPEVTRDKTPKCYGSWGPVLKSREYFNNMHFF
ncbi:hypothetical protein FHG87_007790 [Trinorchestia longiramus]|nr:hypothetical protein FHG87_007790 [Trinorchestia longiramus]